MKQTEVMFRSKSNCPSFWNIDLQSSNFKNSALSFLRFMCKVWLRFLNRHTVKIMCLKCLLDSNIYPENIPEHRMTFIIPGDLPFFNLNKICFHYKKHITLHTITYAGVQVYKSTLQSIL